MGDSLGHWTAKGLWYGHARDLRDYYLMLIDYVPAGPYRMFWLCGPISGIVIWENGKITWNHTDGDPGPLFVGMR